MEKQKGKASKRKRITVVDNGPVDAALNARVPVQKKAALVAWCQNNYRTPSSLVQEWLDKFIEEKSLEIPALEDALTVLGKGGTPQI